jgi:hypothetical protein
MEMRYEPPEVRIGLAVSALGLLASLAAWFLGGRLGRGRAP